LLPMAQAGLVDWGVDTAITDRLLGVIEGRCMRAMNGAQWQIATVHRLQAQHRSLRRHEALREMLAGYIEHMHSNEPVHTWDL
jgi:hypothetical protein